MDTGKITNSLAELVANILQIDEELSAHASRAVNISLTLRNWLIGFYIAEYELAGADRAEYGDRLFSLLSNELEKQSVSNCNRRQLYRYLRFYRFYPQIVGTLSPQFKTLLPSSLSLSETKEGTMPPQLLFDKGSLIQKLAYSHFDLLVDIEEETKRSFYEVESIRGNWSVRELKRQIASLYYERSGFSKEKSKLSKLAQTNAEQAENKLSVRDPYVFEFLGLKSVQLMSESHLEDQLLDKLQDFLIELGHGFCFEARQKRILIGDGYYFVDLVFYHRILKCHVLIELKLEEFSHESIGQLNTYLTWYRKNITVEGDNPPVGVLLCTHKDHALVEYATAGLDNEIFVSKYLLELPKKEEMERFIETELAAVRGME